MGIEKVDEYSARVASLYASKRRNTNRISKPINDSIYDE
jgi:hypothetical protein